MRMSTDPTDRGFRNLVVGTKAYVDGVQHKYAVTADEDAGVLYELVIDVDDGIHTTRMVGGRTRAEGGRPELREVRGKVVLVLPGKGRHAFPPNTGLGVVR